MITKEALEARRDNLAGQIQGKRRLIAQLQAQTEKAISDLYALSGALQEDEGWIESLPQSNGDLQPLTVVEGGENDKRNGM